MRSVMLTQCDSCPLAHAVIVLCLAITSWNTGCEDSSSIQLIPIFPTDEPDLLDRAKIEKLVVTLSSDSPAETLAPVDLLRDESLSIKDIKAGTWSVQVSGVNQSGDEVVHGETAPFDVKPGVAKEVPLFIGRSYAFNLAGLEPASIAESLVGLASHTATAFKDSHEKTWILVAGGRRTNGETLKQALLIDPGNYTIEKLTNELTCARAGHTAIALETKRGVRVVLAGGAEKCTDAIDVFDPTRKTFEKVRVECSGASMRGTVPEIHSLGIGQTGQTGRIIVPGNPMCIVDPLDGSAEQENLGGAAPDNISAAAVNQTGKMLLVSGKTVFIDHGDLTCHQFDTWQPGAIWDAFELDGDVELVPLSRDRFVLLGVSDTEGGEPGFGWALITPNICEFHEIYEGTRTDGLPESGFVPIDLNFDREILVLFTGGRSVGGEPTDSVFSLRETAAEPERIPPSWHELSSNIYGERALKLRIPRADHAVATLPSGGSWVIGGGAEPHKPVEILIRGSADKNSFVPVKKRLELRKPVRTSMVALDTTPGMKELNESFAASYPSHLYGGWSGQLVLFLFASADRGIGDGLIQDIEPNLDGGVTEYCETFDTQRPKEVLAVVQGEDAEDIVLIGPGGGAIPVGGEGINAEEYAVNTLVKFADDHQDGCSWRQLVRVGFDGLLHGGLEAQEQRPAQRVNGINVLVWITSGDDCSQGVYKESGPIPTGDIVLDQCEKEEFNNYFKLPPENWGPEFTEILDALVEDPRDLIVAIVGNVGNDAPNTCSLDGSEKSDGEPLELSKPTRLLEVAEFIGGTGASVMTIDVCEDGIDDNARLEEGLSHLHDTIKRRNYAQTCVPSEVIPPELIGGNSDEAEAVADEVESRCRVVAVQKNQVIDPIYDDEIYKYVLNLPRGASGWNVRADTDRHGVCMDGWLVTLDQVSQELEDVTIVCMD
ncbi:MAG: hypothetical protein GY854_13560 [Deltaproteobacteria bacterium]|nr:hypothetical protein [Deltaproteobacteria bacterium]